MKIEIKAVRAKPLEPQRDSLFLEIGAKTTRITINYCITEVKTWELYKALKENDPLNIDDLKKTRTLRTK
jgi:precorrin-6B methylase 2